MPLIDLQFRALLIHFIFLPRKNFLIWVGGASGGPGCHPPPLVTVSHGLIRGQFVQNLQVLLLRGPEVWALTRRVPGQLSPPVHCQALSVYYIHYNTVLSFPLTELKSVGVWVEGSKRGSMTFMFRCQGESAQCLAVQKHLGMLATPHVQALKETIWNLKIQDWEAFVDAVVSKVHVPLEVAV